MKEDRRLDRAIEELQIVLTELKSLRDARASAEEIAKAGSAQVRHDAYWAEVDAYYRDRARR